MISDKFSEKIEPVFCKEKNIKDLIKSILEIKRQKRNENENETLIIKLGRRLVQRSNTKLSEQILDYLIERYDIDHKKLPTKEELIDMMINFLGNIQKAPYFYKLKNENSEIVFDNSIKNKIGKRLYGNIYKFKLDPSQTKKDKKYLAYKAQNSGIPYPIDVHFTSAVLLVLYGFQPKYYNQFFMEIGSYKNKNKQREFINVSRNTPIYNIENVIEANIKWYILFNFANISDQIHNIMKLLFNNEFIKIDLRSLNTENKHIKSKKYLFCFERYWETFNKYKNEVINELDKLLAIKEEFLINLIKFRTERGCFNVSNEDLANQIGYISSCYKVLNILNIDKVSFEKIFSESVKNFNNHFKINPTFTWMLYLLFKIYILTKSQYIDYINKFNSKSKSYEKIAMIIREGKYSFISQQQIEEEEINEEIKIDNNIKEACEEDIKKEEINNEEIKEEKIEEINNEEIKEEIKIEEIKEENKKKLKFEEMEEENIREVDEHNDDINIKEGKNEKNDILEINELNGKIDNIIEKEGKETKKEKAIRKIKNSLSYINKNKNIKSIFKLKINNIKLAKPQFALNKITFGNIKTENNDSKDISRNNNNLNNYSLSIENLSEINSYKLPTKIKKYTKLNLSYNWSKVSGKKK